MSGRKDSSKRLEHHPSWRHAYLILWQWDLLTQENLEVLFRHAHVNPPADWELDMKSKSDCEALIQLLEVLLDGAGEIEPGGMPRTGGGSCQIH